MMTRDLLTTTEAARVLGCSRQHVVDLCDSGTLRHTTIGTHRRIHNGDVTALARQGEIRREELRSLWLHRAVAGKVVADPERAIALARRNLMRIQRAQPRATAYVRAWERVLGAGPEAILDALTSTSRTAIDLRQNTPFAGLLSEAERKAVLGSFARATDATTA